MLRNLDAGEPTVSLPGFLFHIRLQRIHPMEHLEVELAVPLSHVATDIEGIAQSE